MNTKVITFAALAALGMTAPAIAQPAQNRAAANEIGYEIGALGYAALLKGNYPVALEQMQAAEQQVSPSARRDPARLINEAQAALAAVRTRRAERGTWTLYAAEIDALSWLVALHARQLAECDYGEFDLAFRRTKTRIAQALAGNASPGTRVIAGQLA